jgi:hypothetical protein
VIDGSKAIVGTCQGRFSPTGANQQTRNARRSCDSQTSHVASAANDIANATRIATMLERVLISARRAGTWRTTVHATSLFSVHGRRPARLARAHSGAVDHRPLREFCHTWKGELERERQVWAEYVV